MSENSFGNAREKTPLNDYRFPHPSTKEPVGGGKYNAQMMWELANNGKIIFKVSDGVFNQGGNDQSYRKKQQEIDGFERNAIFQLLMDAATQPDFDKAQYLIKRRQFVREGGQGRLSDRPIVQAVFTVIRDKNGVVSLGYTKSDYKALFVFDKASDSELVDFVNGEYVPAHARMSRIYVLGYVNTVQSFLNSKEFANYKPREPKGGNGGGNNNRGGGNSYGNNNGGGNRGGGNSYGGGNDFDDDIPDF